MHAHLRWSLDHLFLVTVLAAFSGTANSQAGAPPPMMPLPANGAGVYSQQDDLWNQHMEWTYATVAAFASNSPELAPALGTLLQNQIDIGNALKPFYGDAYGTRLSALLTTHIQDAVPVLQAVRSGDTPALNQAVANWYANAGQIGALMGAANPYWAKEDMEAMWHTHITQTIGYSLDLMNGDVAQSLVDYDVAKQHMYVMMSKMISFGLVNGLSTQLYASTRNALLDDSHYARDAVNERLNETTSRGPHDSAFWISPYGSWGRIGASGNMASLDHDVRGVFLGADRVFGDRWRAGVMLGFANASSSLHDFESSSRSDSYQLGLYGGRHAGAWDFRAGAVFAYHDVRADRNIIDIPGLLDSAHAKYGARTEQVFAGIGHDTRFGPATLTPFVDGAFVHLTTDGFTESGDSAAVGVRHTDSSMGYSTLGLRASSELPTIGRVALRVRGSAGWVHAYGNLAPSVDLVFSNGLSFSQSGVPLARDALALNLGVDARVGRQLEVGIQYVGQMNGRVQSNGARADLVYRF